MSSTFMGLNTAYSGLTVAQIRMNIASNNVANADTEGYTRQRVEVSQSTAIQVSSNGYIGTGVEVETISQMRDEFLDSKYRDENATFGEWDAINSVLSQIEEIYNEPSDSGIIAAVDEYYNALQELSINPDDTTARSTVRENAIILTQVINQVADNLTELQENIDYEIEVYCTDVNFMANQIATINSQIYAAELGGDTANDLRDQRNLLLDELSELVPIEYYEDSNGRFNVMVDGIDLVKHDSVNELVLTERDTLLNDVDAEGLHSIAWSGGQSFDPSSGKIKGLLDMRDNMSGDTKGIPYYMDTLNEFADTIASSINDIHKEGYDLDEGTGTYFFTVNGMSSEEYEDYLFDNKIADVTSKIVDDGDTIEEVLASDPSYEGKTIKQLNDGTYLVVDYIDASELTISSDIDNDLNCIAASTSITELPGNGDNALAMADTRNDSDMFSWGSPEDYITSVVSNLGVEKSGAQTMVDNSEVIMKSIDYNRQSVSSVSLDEEMANIVQYQNTYNANARLLTTFDEMLDILINSTGRVGI